jgi:hypothetical protein
VSVVSFDDLAALALAESQCPDCDFDVQSHPVAGGQTDAEMCGRPRAEVEEMVGEADYDRRFLPFDRERYAE